MSGLVELLLGDSLEVTIVNIVCFFGIINFISGLFLFLGSMVGVNRR